jgi:solute:Na+ symporter, SSS family
LAENIKSILTQNLNAVKATGSDCFSVYMVGVTLFGSSFTGKTNQSIGIYAGQQRHSRHGLVAMSIFATFVSSISFLALPGSGLPRQLECLCIQSVNSLLLPILAVKLFVPLYRKANSPSAYAYLESRFGPWARIYASACYLLTQIMRMGTILYSAGFARQCHVRLGYRHHHRGHRTCCNGVFLSLAGIQAVVWTDAIQGIIHDWWRAGMFGIFIMFDPCLKDPGKCI